MPDDRFPRARSHVDFATKRRTPVGGVPVEVDPELTPPPQAPPEPGTFEAMSPAEQLRVLHATGTENAAAIGRIWELRDMGGRLERMDARIDRAIPNLERAVAALDHWVPQLQTVMAQTARMWEEHIKSSNRLGVFLENEWPRTVKTIEGVAKTLDDVIGRLGRVEHGQQDMTRNHGVMSAELRSLQNIANSHDVRITAIEQRHRDEQNIAKGEELVVARATKWASALKGAIGAGAVAIAWLISKLV